MDVDGTMTDGSVTLLSQPDGSALEIKTFDAHDGQGLTLAHTAGLRTGCITGRESPALLRRAHEMKMDFVYMKIALKMPAYEEILQKAGVPDSAIIAETHSRSTSESARRTAVIARVNGLHRLVIVSDGTHMFRIHAICAADGLNVLTSPRPHTGAETASQDNNAMLHEIITYTLWRLHLD